MKTRSACGWGKACLKGAAASAIAILVATGAANAQSAQRAERGAQEIRAFDIPAQPLAGAIIKFAEQANLRLIAPQALADGKTAPALKGDYTSAEALARLLEGTDLTFEITADGRLLLRKKPAAKGTAPDNSGHASQPLERIQTAQAGQPASDENRSQDTEKNEESVELEEIVVTGSNIRGTGPVGSKLIVFDQKAIRRTGFSTVQDVVQSLPQNFGGGPNPVTSALQPGVNGANFNTSAGSSINLRGLGPTSTLTLVNGRRVALAGTGQFVDVSLIPLAAVERIEVLTDGASAIYGTDAVAGVTNIILKRDFEGAETKLRVGSVTSGGQQEFKASQLVGWNWSTGNFFASYEYQNSDPLFSEERDFAASNDLRPLGGSDFRTQLANPGNIVAGGQTFAIPSGQNGTALTPDKLLPGVVNLQNERAGTTLIPGQERHSVFTSARQTLTRWLDLFVQGSFSRREFRSQSPAQTLTLTVPDTNPFFVDPIGGLSSVQVQYSFFNDLGPQSIEGRVRDFSVTAGAELDLFTNWHAELYGFLSQQNEARTRSGVANRSALSAALADSNPETAFNPFGDGSNTNPETLKRIEGFVKIADSQFRLWGFEGKADGRLFRLPAGPVKLAVGTQYREESLARETIDFEFALEPVVNLRPTQKRKVFALFGEIFIPLLGEANAAPGIKRLEISAAFRLEDYSDFGTTTNPKFGLRWSPVSGIDLRGTYGTAFRTPSLIDLNTQGNVTFFFPLPDPRSATGISNAIVLAGNDPELGPETARTWTVGIDVEPETISNLTLSATYFSISFKDRIGRAADIFGILAQDDIFAPLIIRNPAPADVQGFFDDPGLRNIVGSTDPNDVDAIVNFLLTNIGRTKVRGLDFTAHYSFGIDLGRLDFRLNASILFDFKEAVTATAPFFQRVGTIDRPVDWRMRNSVTWTYGGFASTVFLNYVDNYTNDNIDPSEPVRAHLTADLSLSYSFGDRPSDRWLNGLGLRVSVINLGDKAPPFVNNPRGFGFDPEQANPQGRFLAFEITKRW